MARVIELIGTCADVVWAILILLCGIYAAEGSYASGKYSIHSGWIAENTTGELTAVTAIQCALYTFVPGNSVYPLATYNKTTSSCETISNVTQNIFLRNTSDENDMVLMNESNCTQFVHVFKVYTDTVFEGNDVIWNVLPTKEDCIGFCDQNYPEFKAVMYNYDMSSDGMCLCKDLSRQEHIDMGYSIDVFPGFNYYERLC